MNEGEKTGTAPDLGDQVVERVLARDAWLRTALKRMRDELEITTFDRAAHRRELERRGIVATPETLIVTWLLEPDTAERSNLRARLREHRLDGVDDSTLERVAALVRHACDSIRCNDVDALKQLAAKADELADHATDRGRDAHALEVSERAIADARVTPCDAQRAARIAYQLAQAYPALARAGFVAALQVEVNAIASAPPAATGKRGRGHKGAPALLAWAMTSAGVCSAKQARNRIDVARRRSKPKK